MLGKPTGNARLKHNDKLTMHPAMNFGASVTNCESNMYTAATLHKGQDLPVLAAVHLLLTSSLRVSYVLQESAAPENASTIRSEHAL